MGQGLLLQPFASPIRHFYLERCLSQHLNECESPTPPAIFNLLPRLLTSPKMASFSCIPCLLFLLLLFVFAEPLLSYEEERPDAAEMRPAAPSPELRLTAFNSTRRQLGRFQICGLCTCCGGPKGLCLSSPCCYEISCNIPNRPFGFCSFVPKACNCFACNL